MPTCQACGADEQHERFCGACGQLLRSRDPWSGPGGAPGEERSGASGVAAPSSADGGVAASRRDAERSSKAVASRRWWTVVAVLAAVATVTALGTALRPSPEVVNAGRWRGDGTGTTSTRAAVPEQVLWTSRRLAVGSLEHFRDAPLVPLGRHEDLLLVQADGYVTALDTVTGDIRWERYVDLFGATVHDGRVHVPHGPGVATWDAATGEEVGWFPLTDGVPLRVVAATDDFVAVELVGLDDTTTAIVRLDGTLVGEHRTAAHAWDTTAGPRLVLVDPRAGSIRPVDPATGVAGEAIDVPPGGVRAAAGPWVLSTWSETDGAVVVDVDAGRRYDVSPDTIADPVELVDAGGEVVLFGTSPRFRAPPQGNDVAVRIDRDTGETRSLQLDAGFGDAIGDADGSVLARTGSLIRLVDVGSGAERIRWERGTDDATLPVVTVDGLVGQFERDRILAWDAVTGRRVVDVQLSGLPGPDRRTGVRSQPYVRDDGFVLDASDTLTLVIDPVGGERVDVRNSVHVASTPVGDIATRAGQVQLLSPDGRIGWQRDVEGPFEVAVTDTTVAILSSDGGGRAELRTHRLRDGTTTGTVSWPSRFVGDLQRVDDRLVSTGDGVAAIELGADGPRLAWRAPGIVEPDATALQVGDELVLVGRGVVTRFGASDGEPRGRHRLPPTVAPFTAYRDATVYATAGSHVVALDVASVPPRTVWAAAVGSRITSAPTLAGDRLYVGTEDGSVVVLTLGGEVVAQLATGFERPVVGAPTVANGLVYVFADRGRHLVAMGSPDADDRATDR